MSKISNVILMLQYLENGKKYNIKELSQNYNYNFDVNCDAFEIFTGYERSTSSKYLESTMIESGIGIPIIHDKYSYCHGRSTTSISNNNTAIFFDTGTELNKLLLLEINKYYKDVMLCNLLVLY